MGNKMMKDLIKDVYKQWENDTYILEEIYGSGWSNIVDTIRYNIDDAMDSITDLNLAFVSAQNGMVLCQEKVQIKMRKFQDIPMF